MNFLKEKSRTWSNGSQDEKRQARELSCHSLAQDYPLDCSTLSDARSISFITRGVPYGVLPFRCPSTHYFSFPLLGLSVLSGMLKSQAHVRCPIVVLIDPNTVGQSEFETLRKTFGAAGYHLRLAYGGGATIQNTTYLSQFLPSHFIFFSTHCGEPDGHQIVERFPDRYGNPTRFAITVPSASARLRVLTFSKSSSSTFPFRWTGSIGHMIQQKKESRPEN